MSPPSVSGGGTVTATWTVKNQGTGAANASQTVVRVTQSSTSAAGSNLFTYSTAALAANASVPLGATITASTTPGTYYVWVIVDNSGSAGQPANATDNDIVQVGSFTVTSPPPAGTPTCGC